jgi:hypothetical protein
MASHVEGGHTVCRTTHITLQDRAAPLTEMYKTPITSFKIYRALRKGKVASY